MKPHVAREILRSAIVSEEPATLPPAVLKYLSTDDVPEGVAVEVGIQKDKTTYMEWDGVLYVAEGRLKAEARHLWTRKYWYAPLGLEHYLDLVRRAIEVRSVQKGDVELQDYEDDGAFIYLSYLIDIPERNLGRAYRYVRKLAQEIEEAAENAVDKVGRLVSETAQRVSGWGEYPLDQLVEAIETAKSSDERGRSLEELMCRLFDSLYGFSISSRVRTATEEIDIVILNDSNDPRFRRESAILLAECKNWSGKCGKNEFVIFKEKIENRSKRCSLGFLISWNGFAETITKEMLRGSREDTLVIPLEGKDIRCAVREDGFKQVLSEAWDRAVAL